jgi:putative ABC transport system permease protein
MTVLDDVRYGLRLLWKAPGFTAIAAGTLALAIAANTAIFSVVYATLLAPMAYPDPDQLVMVWSSSDGNRRTVSPADFRDWRRQGDAFQAMGAWASGSVSLSVDGRPESVNAAYLTPGFHTMVGNPFALGRDFLAEEGALGRSQVAVLSHQMWRERFGGDPAIIGRTIRVDRRPHEVVGVLASGEGDRSQAPISLPLVLPEDAPADAAFLLVMGRLKPGVGLDQANARMRTVADGLAALRPEANRNRSVLVQPLKNNFLPDDTVRGLWLMLGAVAFVLLIACANVANLLLARGTGRRREVAVRAAIGASRARVFRQFLTESLLLSAMGALLGLALAGAMLDAILALMPPGTLPIEADVRLNLPVLAVTVAATMLTGVLSGLAPAWQAMRLDLDSVLREEGRGMIGGGRQRLRRSLVAAEFALALTLLTGAGIAAGSLLALVRSDVGFRTDHVLAFTLSPPPERIAGASARDAFAQGVLERIQALPGVRSAALSTGYPGRVRFGRGFRVAGDPEPAPGNQMGAAVNMVTPAYYDAFGLSLVRGRVFDARDVAGAPRVAIVNDVFVAQYLAGRDPLGQRLLTPVFEPDAPPVPVEWQIVGVYRGARLGGNEGTFPEIDVPLAQSAWRELVVAVHTAGEPHALRADLAAAIRSIDPDLPMANVKTTAELVGETRGGHRFQAVLFAAFAALALVLAALGIYGVMSFMVAQRRHEIGVRMALGADRTRMLRLVLGDGLRTAALGAAVGCVGAFFVGRAMQGMWNGAARVDPVAFAVVLAALFAAAALACLVPARRAASVDPLTALRDE